MRTGINISQLTIRALVFSGLAGLCTRAIADPIPSTFASCFVLNGVFNTSVFDAVMASTQTSGTDMGATGSCMATATYGTLRASATVTAADSGVERQSEASAKFTDEVLLFPTSTTSKPGFLRFHAALDGISSGTDDLTFHGSATFVLQALGLDNGPILATCAILAGDGRPDNGTCEALLPIDLGSITSFDLQGRLNPFTDSRVPGVQVFADYSHTAQLGAIDLLDADMNFIRPGTLTGVSGSVYGLGAQGEVPEPGTDVLIGSVLLFAAAIARYRRRGQTKT